MFGRFHKQHELTVAQVGTQLFPEIDKAFGDRSSARDLAHLHVAALDCCERLNLAQLFRPLTDLNYPPVIALRRQADGGERADNAPFRSAQASEENALLSG